MSQTDYNDNVVTFTIDRTPDHNILNQYYFRRFDILEEYDENSINIDTISELTSGDRIIAREYINQINNLDNDEENYNNYNIFNTNTTFNMDDDFIPFNPQSNITETDTPSINFIVDNLLSHEELNCCICMEEHEDWQICQLNCQHTFCVNCIDMHLERKYTCPLCREDIEYITTQTTEARQQIHH
jgi:hypothetical protein